MDNSNEIRTFINEVFPQLSAETCAVPAYEYISAIEGLEKVVNGLKQPSRILFLGLGSSLVALWFAKKHPNAHVVVIDVDVSQEKYEEAKSLANKLGVVNISYEPYECDKWAPTTHQGFDLVLAHAAMDCENVDWPKGHNYCEGFQPDFPVSPSADFVARTISQTLAPDGTAILAVDEEVGWGLVHLFQAVRNSGLSVKWIETARLWDMRFGDRRFVLVGKMDPQWFANSYDDAVSFLAPRHADGLTFLDHRIFMPLSDLLMTLPADAQLLYKFTGEAEQGYQVSRSVSFWHGLCISQETTDAGFREQVICGPESVFLYYQSDKEDQHVWVDEPLTNVSVVITPHFQRLLDFYGEDAWRHEPPRDATGSHQSTHTPAGPSSS